MITVKRYNDWASMLFFNCKFTEEKFKTISAELLKKYGIRKVIGEGEVLCSRNMAIGEGITTCNYVICSNKKLDVWLNFFSEVLYNKKFNRVVLLKKEFFV